MNIYWMIYKFCINSPYYEMLVQLLIKKKTEIENIEKCDIFSTDITFSKNPHVKNICQEFKFLYKSLSENPVEVTTVNDMFLDTDCDFLNYWLNDKLREYVSDGSNYVKQFYEKIKEQNATDFSKHVELGKYMYVIDPYILENMKFLYEIYYNAVKIINMITDQVDTDEEQKSCSYYIKEFDEKYKEAMNRSLNSNIDYYNALKIFNASYDIIFDTSFNKLKNCNYDEFLFFPKYDPVLERKQRNIMAGKILSAPLIMSFVIPLLYKYTPLGPYLRTKINNVKNRWMDSEEYGSELSSLPTDIEDNISDNMEYNIGYYSGTN
ncbi:PIR protein [Plasmodium ovale]|uniref:PIR protein n=1 Tax=Plasmodium ovale TaxID=36330 RepID=A0A1D3JC94_PLAOA|nr:PIR protein [Plasmodium ovale]